MLRQVATVGAMAVVLLTAGCQANPKQTVLELDTTDRRWTSRECVRHRKAAADYDDGQRTRALIGFADYAVPFAGTATSLLMSWRMDPQRAALNERILAACVSPSRMRARGYEAQPYREYARQRPGRSGRGAYAE